MCMLDRGYLKTTVVSIFVICSFCILYLRGWIEALLPSFVIIYSVDLVASFLCAQHIIGEAHEWSLFSAIFCLD